MFIIYQLLYKKKYFFSYSSFGFVFGRRDFDNTTDPNYNNISSRDRYISSNSTNKNSKESQWEALKMLMAERAADCLAKLGLDNLHNNNNNTLNQTSNNNLPISSSSSQSQMDGFKGYQQPTAQNICYSTTSTVNLSSSNGTIREPLRVLGGHVSPTTSFSMLSSSSEASSKPSAISCNNKLQLGNSQSQPQPNTVDSNGLFNSHHRRFVLFFKFLGIIFILLFSILICY